MEREIDLTFWVEGLLLLGFDKGALTWNVNFVSLSTYVMWLKGEKSISTNKIILMNILIDECNMVNVI